MAVYVDDAQADRILAEATELARKKAYRVPREMETKIEQIIGHTHLTYRYILLNGLLAKATNPAADPLALQAGAPLKGAFDARSLCHSVVVPFEQTVLEKRLGGSNEPFLNKPARYTHLSSENAVRRGMDRKTLDRLISLFEMVNEHGDGQEALVCVLAHILELDSRVVVFEEGRFADLASKRALTQLCKGLLDRSCEGESLALTVALLFELVAKTHGGDLVVVSHPANQSGSSSKEISDVDVFEADRTTVRFCCEAKDKPFGRADIDHAAGKVAESGHSAMLFLYGPNARPEVSVPAVVQEYEAKGFDLSILPATDFAASVITLAPSVNWEEVTDLLNKHLGLMRAKEETVRHCREALQKV